MLGLHLRMPGEVRPGILRDFAISGESRNPDRSGPARSRLVSFQVITRLGLLLLFSVSVTARALGQTPEPSPQHLEEIHRFWQETLAKSKQLPLDAEVEKVKDYLPYEKYQVTYRSTDGVRIRAFLSRPVEAGKPGAHLPAIISLPGYGGWQQSVMLDECMRGYIILQVYPRSQGESAALWKIDGPDKLTWHIAHPEGYYYQGALVDIIRGMDYMVSREDVDATRMGAMGTSQAGGLVLMLAALDPRIKALTASLPFLCNMRLCATIEGSLVQNLLTKYGVMNENSFNTLDYFDPFVLAPDIKAPALISAGGKDTVCPAAGTRSVFDRLGGIKAMAYYPDVTHTSSGDFYLVSWDWINRYLKP